MSERKFSNYLLECSASVIKFYDESDGFERKMQPGKFFKLKCPKWLISSR